MEDQKVKVKACHTNPIFYKVNGSLQSQILNKDNEVELKNSDKFSLLPNSEFEYEVKITQDDDENPVESSACTSAVGMRVRNVVEINVNLQAGNMATSLSQIIATSANAEADTTNEEGVGTNRVQQDLDRTPSPDMLVAPSDFVQASPSRSGRKRSFEGDAEGSEESNKRVKSSTDPENAVSCSTTNAEPTGSDDHLQTVNPPAVLIKPDPDSTSVSTSVASSTSTSVTTSSSSSTTAPKIKPDPDGSPSTTTGATVAASSTDAVKKENPNTSPSQSAQATPTSTPGIRPSCEFGIRCYRNTPDHMRDVAHPSDADYRRPTYPPADAGAPNCPWGASCYRRNPDHFRQLHHPSSSSNY
jgi:PBZ domain